MSYEYDDLSYDDFDDFYDFNFDDCDEHSVGIHLSTILYD
eukprot:gene6251-10259_t